MLELRLPLADALEEAEAVAEWPKDMHERPIQQIRGEVRDAHGHLLVEWQGTLRLHRLHDEAGELVEPRKFLTRKALIGSMRNPPEPAAPDERAADDDQAAEGADDDAAA